MMKNGVSAPLVSVIIPAYNCAPYIREAVESALDQLDPPPEVVVVDDGSTDDTHQVLLPYLNRIQYVYQENQGQSAARNHGLHLSQGEYVVFLDADDILLPDTLSEKLACLEMEPSLGMIHSGVRLVDEKGEMLEDVEPWHDVPRLDLETCVLYKPVYVGAMMLRRIWLEHVGGFDPSLRWAEDVDLLLRLALGGCKMGWLHRPSVKYRQHDKSITQDAVQEAKHLEIVLDKFFARPEVPERIRRLEKNARYYGLIWAARRLYSMGQTEQIAELLRRSLSYSPYSFEQTIAEWMTEFTEEQALEGDPSEVGDWIPYLQSAVSPDRLPWARSQKLFRWWLEIWRFYVDDDDEECIGRLAAYRKLGPNDLIALTRSSLMMTPVHKMVNVVTRFWEDARVLGMVQGSQQYEVTALYLTAFGQAFMAGEWTMARRALFRAVRSSAHPRAVRSWLRFIHSALTYFVSQHEDAELENMPYRHQLGEEKNRVKI